MLVDVFVLKVLQEHLQVVRQDGDQVDGVQDAASKTAEVGGGQQAEKILQGEEGDAERLDILAIEPAAWLARRRLEQMLISDTCVCSLNYYSTLARMVG